MNNWPVDSTVCPDCKTIGLHNCPGPRRTSHFTEAERLLDEADQSGPQTAELLIARASVHALLAVAESQAAQVQHIRKAVH